MASKLYCEGSIKHLAWVIVALTVAILAGARFYAAGKAGATPQGVTPLGAAMPVAADPAQFGAVDAITMATPKGGMKLVGRTQQAPTSPAAAGLLSPVPLENIQEILNNVAATIKPAVVHIEVLRPGPGAGGRVESIGSGFLVDRRGYILTNYHVMQDATSISATVYSQTGSARYDAKIVHSDAQTDLAVLQINDAADFPVARLGNSSTTEVGDWAMAVGSPLDLAQTVSLGIISALRETVRIDGATYSDMIQTDAHINKGNSGGPLVNAHGEVIGINTAVYTPGGDFTGVGFAIPIEHAEPLLNELNIASHRFAGAMANLVTGQAGLAGKGSWLGVEGLSLSRQMAAKLSVREAQGVYVTNVFVNSPAHRSGLLRGDVISWLDGKRIGGIDELRSTLRRTQANRRISLRVCRANRVFDVAVSTTEKW
jgi:S1-C subfamily serine protease